MKILFLDLDGVLNTANSWGKPEVYVESKNRMKPPVGFNQLDQDCISRLNKITDKTGAKIVISSSWRTLCVLDGTVDALFKHLQNEGVTGQIIGVTPLDKECGFISEEYPDGSRGYRAYEIQAWLKDKQNVDTFVVLDDGDWFMKPLKENFVWMENDELGLQDEHVDKAISILNTYHE